MHSRISERREQKALGRSQAIVGSAFFLVLLFRVVLCPVVFAGISDRVVAYVDNTAITLSEFLVQYEATVKAKPDISKEEVLNTMINRILMLREAKKMRLQAPSEDQLLKEYIDLKIRAFIRIRDEEIGAFYKSHINDFEGKTLDEVREQIENYLVEKEVNRRLKTHIGQLRGESCIQIQLDRK